MISLLLVAVAAFFNAVMNKLCWHFERSLFAGLNAKWWNPNVSWAYVKFVTFTMYRADAWHLSKTIMLCCLCAVVVCYRPIITCFKVYWLNIISDFMLFSTIWCTVFNLCFNRLLAAKKF